MKCDTTTELIVHLSLFQVSFRITSLFGHPVHYREALLCSNTCNARLRMHNNWVYLYSTLSRVCSKPPLKLRVCNFLTLDHSQVSPLEHSHFKNSRNWIFFHVMQETFSRVTTYALLFGARYRSLHETGALAKMSISSVPSEYQIPKHSPDRFSAMLFECVRFDLSRSTFTCPCHYCMNRDRAQKSCKM